MVKVRVEQGWLQGERLPLVTGDGSYCSFKGIPYAAPPLGPLRFQDPQPAESWVGVRTATTHGPVSYQRHLLTGETVGSEDCLYLNVYCRDLAPPEPRAVMVFIHGGGFVAGSGDSDMHGPEFLVENDVVLVTMNYRLGVLGFLCLDVPEAPGNVGLKDQVAALRWINRNISRFGGDPSNVTLFGDSVGSACAALHALSPLSRNLVHKAIAMSDSPFCDIPAPFLAQKRALAFGKRKGFATDDPEALFQFLKYVPLEQMLDSRASLLASEDNMSLFKMSHFGPVVEKDFGQDAFLLEDPMKLLLSGHAHASRVMAGYTTDEALCALTVYGDALLDQYQKYPELYVPRPVLYEKSPRDALRLAEKIIDFYFSKKPFNVADFVQYLGDVTFKYHIQKLLRLFSNTAVPCYFYRFSGYSERNVFGNQREKFGVTGASHYDDLLHLFNSRIHNLPPVGEGSGSHKIIRNLSTLFTNFAKHGNPTPDSGLGVAWPEYGAGEACLDVGEELRVTAAPDAAAAAFWERVYQQSGAYGSYNH